MKTKDTLETSREPRVEWLKRINQMLENAAPIEDLWNNNSSNNVSDIADSEELSISRIFDQFEQL